VGIYCKLTFQLKRDADNKVFLFFAGDDVKINDIVVKVSKTIFSKFYEIGWEYVKKAILDSMKTMVRGHIEKTVEKKVNQLNATMILSDIVLRRIFDLQESRDLEEATPEEIKTGVITSR
jgi:hypothetical protein